jgi:hypothetical protein
VHRRTFERASPEQIYGRWLFEVEERELPVCWTS